MTFVKGTENDGKNIKCYHCRKIYYTRKCPDNVGQVHANLTGEATEYDHHIFHQMANGVLSRDWLLLDNQGTVDQFKNPTHVTNINVFITLVHIHCNSEESITNKKWGKLCVVQSKGDNQHHFPKICEVTIQHNI